MRTNTKKLLAIVLVAVMMASAGCTGWGTDGPADSEPNQSGDSNASDDLEETQNDTNDSEGDSSDGSDTSTSSGGDDTTESDGAPDDSGAEDSGSSGDSDSEPQSSTDDDSSPDSDGSDGADGSDGSDGSDGADGDGGDSGDGDEQLTCDAFDTQPEAQTYYDEAPEERGHLDANNDDIPCESLPDGDSSGGDDDNDSGDIGATLTVTVEDQEGNPVEGIEVVGIGPDAEIYSAETNADGQATYDSLPAGDYEYHVTTDGTEYEESTTEQISLAGGDDESLTVTVSDTDSGEPETSTLTVAVNNHNGEPVENASVTVVTADGGDEVASGTTDGDGVVTFDVENGEYDVIVEHEAITGDAASRVTVDGDTEDSLTLDTSDQLATGIVKVVDQNGDPVEGEPVTLWPPGTVEEEATETRETDANGEVRIELAAGEPEDVAMFDVVVRDQEQTLGIMADAYAGVQEVTFEVDTADPGENETGDVNETNTPVALASVG